jgi:hypothetical protein
MEFTRDGRFLLAATPKKTIVVWELATCTPVWRLSGHTRVPGALALSPNRRFAVSAGNYGGGDGTPSDAPLQIRFWDIATGEQVAGIAGHNEDVSSLAFSPDGKLLAAGMYGTTALVWEVPEAARVTGFKRQPLSDADADTLWGKLASTNAEEGQKAVVRLAQDAPAAIALAEKNLQPVVSPPAEMIRSLIEELASDEFQKREAATARLAAFGSAIAGQLTEAAEKSEVLEVRLRCNDLLEKASKRFAQSGPMRQQTRAVQLLEWIGNPEAVALLNRLAGGAKEAHLTTEAAAALARLEK